MAKQLPGVLAHHAEGGRLKEAFDRVNEMRDTRTYDRTTLPRWLSGESTPSDEKFVRVLAGELGDQEIVSAWVADRCGTDRDVLDLFSSERLVRRKQASRPETFDPPHPRTFDRLHRIPRHAAPSRRGVRGLRAVAAARWPDRTLPSA